MDVGTTTAFICYLAVLLVIAIISYKKSSTSSDYFLGGRSLGSMVTALSAGASDMSGWLLLGLPGALYSKGGDQIFLGVGLIVGSYLNWHFLAPRLRVYTELAKNSITLPDYFENRFGGRARGLRVLSAIVILLFFTFYTSSGLVGGAVLFEETFGIPYFQSLILGTIVIVFYTFLGGFLAVSWTDFFQGTLMLIALILVPSITIKTLGGWEQTFSQLHQIDPTALNFFSGTGTTTLGIISLLAWGLGYFGQPHILARFMAISKVSKMKEAKNIAMTWMFISLIGAGLSGLIGIIFFANNPLENPEKVFISLTQSLFNPWLAGIVLAAILSAIMSTVDSQLLVSSSALAEDFYKAIIRPNASEKELMWVSRSTVLLIAIIAFFLAMDPKGQILQLVSYAWAGLGGSFGPIVLISLFWSKMTKEGAMCGLLVGAITVIVWGQLSGGLFELYELLPAFVFNSITIFIVSKFAGRPEKDTIELFEKVDQTLKQEL